MKEIQKKESVYLEDYGVTVNQYLTYAQIEGIADAVGKFTTWAERMQNLDMLLLVFATDLTPEQVEEIGHETLDGSGLIDAVKETVVNYHKVNEAISYNEGTQRALAQILKQLPSILTPLKKTIKKHGQNKK